MSWLFAIHQNEVNVNMVLLTFVYPTLLVRPTGMMVQSLYLLLLVELGLLLPFLTVNYKLLTEELCKFKRARRLPCVLSPFPTFYCDELWGYSLKLSLQV